jgi:hypothetical protein
MIPVNQLRLGNYFHPCSTKVGIIIPNTDIVWKVGMIDKFGKIAVIEPENHETIYLTANEAAPILLAEEWLLRIGAKKERYLDGVYTYNKFMFIASKHPEKRHFDRLSVFIMNYGEKVLLKEDVSYLHQIQNITHCLTGDELTIK